jgi:ParB family transcriptional regulator, chromosome partitioning protein
MTDMARRRLGRGLEALLGPSSPVVEAAPAPSAAPLEVSIAEIEPNPFQPRHDVDEQELAELASSIKSAGLLQPIVVRERPDGRYEVIAGERRLRACRELGWTTIPVVKREVDDRTMLTLALIENLQRDDLSPVDEAQGYRRLIDDFGMSQEAVAEVVGKDRSTVANALRLLRLPAMVLTMLHKGELAVGHARALLMLNGDEAMVTRLAREAVARAWSVREMEDEARAGTGRKAARRTRRNGAGQGMSAEARSMEDALRRRLQTDVRLSVRPTGRGQIRIDVYSHEDLSRVLDLILGRPYGA